MNNKLKITVFVVIILLVVLLLFWYFQQAVASTHFQDSNTNLSFDYPLYWGQPIVTNDENFYSISFDIPAKYSNPDIYALKQEYGPTVEIRRLSLFEYETSALKLATFKSDLSLEDIRTALVKGNIVGGEKTLEDKYVLLGGFNFYRTTTASYYDSGDTKQTQLFLIDKNTVWAIYLLGSPRNYDPTLPEFENMLNSIKLSK